MDVNTDDDTYGRQMQTSQTPTITSATNIAAATTIPSSSLGPPRAAGVLAGFAALTLLTARLKCVTASVASSHMSDSRAINSANTSTTAPTNSYPSELQISHLRAADGVDTDDNAVATDSRSAPVLFNLLFGGSNDDSISDTISNHSLDVSLALPTTADPITIPTNATDWLVYWTDTYRNTSNYSDHNGLSDIGPAIDEDALSVVLLSAEVLLACVLCVLIVITLIGNTLVILAVITTRRLRTVTNCFVMSLAVADWLVGIFVMPPAVAVHLIGSWQLGWVLCDIWISLDVLLCTASILSLCAISIDRYLAITSPLMYSKRRRSKRLALYMIMVVWVLALAITCPPILGWYEPGRRDLHECRYNQNEGYVIFSAMGSFFIPMAVMIYVYVRISCVVGARHNEMLKMQEMHMPLDQQNPHHTIANAGVLNNTAATNAATLDDIEIYDPEQSSDQDYAGHSPYQQRRLHGRQSAESSSSAQSAPLTADSSGGRRTRKSSAAARVTTGTLRNGGDYELVTTAEPPSRINRSQQHHHQHQHHHHQAQQHLHQNQFRHTVVLHIADEEPSASASASTVLLPPSTPQHLSQRQQQQRLAINQSGHRHMSQHSATAAAAAAANSSTQRITSMKRESKTTQTLSIVVGGFIVCWLPFFVYYLITPFLPQRYISGNVTNCLTWLGWFNSAMNPFIYAFYSVDFRAAFWRLTLRRFCKDPMRSAYAGHVHSMRH